MDKQQEGINDRPRKTDGEEIAVRRRSENRSCLSVLAKFLIAVLGLFVLAVVIVVAWVWWADTPHSQSKDVAAKTIHEFLTANGADDIAARVTDCRMARKDAVFKSSREDWYVFDVPKEDLVRFKSAVVNHWAAAASHSINDADSSSTSFLREINAPSWWLPNEITDADCIEFLWHSEKEGYCGFRICFDRESGRVYMKN